MNMLRFSAICTSALMLLSGPGLAQDLTQPQAQALGKQAGSEARVLPGNRMFDAGTIAGTVTPYAGPQPPEAGIAPSQLENKTNEAILGNSTGSDAYQATKDSILLRPDQTVSSGDQFLQPGVIAERSAEQSLDGTFSASGSGVCSVEGFSQSEPFERFCDAYTKAENKTCSLTRIVEVDRRDTWQCDWKRNFTEKACSVTYTPSCVSTPNCRVGSLSASSTGPTPVWNGAGTVASWSAGWRSTSLGGCSGFGTYYVNVTSAPRFQPLSVSITASGQLWAGSPSISWLRPDNVWQTRGSGPLDLSFVPYGKWEGRTVLQLRITPGSSCSGPTTNGWYTSDSRHSVSITFAGPCCDSISWSEAEQCGQ